MATTTKTTTITTGKKGGIGSYLPQFNTSQLPGIGSTFGQFFGLPFNATNIGNELGKYYQNSLGQVSSMVPFGNQFQDQFKSGMNQTLGDLSSISADQFSNNLFNRGKTVLDERLAKNQNALKENMFGRGFGNSSSHVLGQNQLNTNYSRDLGELNNSAALGGQQLYNSSANNLMNMGNFYQTQADSPLQNYYNQNQLYGNALLNMIGRQNELQNVYKY